MTPSEIEPATFWLVAQCLKQLRHHQRAPLMYKYKTYFTCEITLHVAQTVNTEQLQHCVDRRDMVCFRYIIVNTCMKGITRIIHTYLLTYLLTYLCSAPGVVELPVPLIVVPG